MTVGGPENVLDEVESWCLEFSFGRHGASLSICYMNCNSLEECRGEYEHLLMHSTPLWAHAVRRVVRYTESTTVFILKLGDPPTVKEEV